MKLSRWYMISKELLSEVLDVEVRVIAGVTSTNELKYNNDSIAQFINIYELAHKNLKQWAKLKNIFDKIEWSAEPEQIFNKAEELRNEVS